jgi:two-component system, LytTR family, response regulator
MSKHEMIKTVIIDDNMEYLDSLREHLSLYPEIELQGFATQYPKAIRLITKTTPDLVFLDIDIPGRNGFDLLADARKVQKTDFKVIFYTTHDKYMFRALRESAFDYILKPLDPKELRCSIDRFKTIRKEYPSTLKPPIPLYVPGNNGIISLPTNTGLKFLNQNAIVLFRRLNGSCTEKTCWRAILTDQSQVKLRNGTSAKEILGFMGQNEFAQINQSTIVNICYLGTIEYKTRDCRLVLPYTNFQLTASRTHLSELKDKYDIL